MRIVSLASGSKGNAYLVGAADGAWLLVDDGLPWATFRTRWRAAVGTDDLSALAGVLVTHDHGDHVCGLPSLLKHCGAPVFANALTIDVLVRREGLDDSAFGCFENGQDFEVGPFSVHPFSIPHDTPDPVGYRVRVDGLTYFHGTDIGAPRDAVGVQFGLADYAVLEANHDSVMLRQSGRPPHIIQRIAGASGHLSNDQAAELVERFASPRLKALGLAHLSGACNAAHLAEAAVCEALRARGLGHVAMRALPADGPVALAGDVP